MKKIILILLSALIAVSMVSGLEQLPFKNAILLEEGLNSFGIRLNDSFEVTSDINVSLTNSSTTSAYTMIGYSSKKSISVDDVIFYKQDGSSLTYQDAKANNWIEGINVSIGGNVGDEATSLEEYEAYWVKSFLAVNMTLPNVGGSNTSGTIARDDLLFYNGTDYLYMLDAESVEHGWVDSPAVWDNLVGRGHQDFDFLSSGDNLNTWQGYVIFSHRPNIYLLFENKTIPPQNIIVRYEDDTATIPENYIERFDDGSIEITVPKNIFKRIYRWIANLV